MASYWKEKEGFYHIWSKYQILYAAQFHLIPQNDFSFAISLFLYSRLIPLGRARHDDKLIYWSFWQWRRIFLKNIKRCRVERKIFKSIIPFYTNKNNLLSYKFSFASLHSQVSTYSTLDWLILVSAAFTISRTLVLLGGNNSWRPVAKSSPLKIFFSIWRILRVCLH